MAVRLIAVDIDGALLDSRWQLPEANRKAILPVEIPAGTRWAPTENSVPLFTPFKVSFTAYATTHRLIGWILVPLGVGALAGLLRRSGKPLDKAP